MLYGNQIVPPKPLDAGSLYPLAENKNAKRPAFTAYERLTKVCGYRGRSPACGATP